MDTIKSPLERVLEIPEIIERVSAHQDRKTIASAIRVSKSWHRAYLPILWHTIDNGKHWNDPRFLKAIVQHGDLIRVLVCARYDEIDLLIPPPKNGADTLEQSVSLCRFLTKIIMPKTASRNQKQQAQFIRQNPGLLDLSLTFNDQLSSTFTDLVDAIGDLKHLRRLSFDGNRSLESTTLETILQRCSRVSPDGNGSLQELSLSNTSFLRHPFGRGEDFASGVVATTGEDAHWTDTQNSHDTIISEKEPFAITTLRMNKVGCVQDLLLNLCSRFPSLSKLSLSEADEVYCSNGFSKRLAHRCPNIKWLDVSNTEDMDDESMAELISSFPGLQTFIAAETRFGTESLNALVEHCRDLAVLDITNAYEMDSAAMQRLLNSSWSLRSLNAWGVAYNIVEMMQEAHREQKRQGASSTLTDGQPWLTKLQYLALETSLEDCGDASDHDDCQDDEDYYGQKKEVRDYAVEDEDVESNEVWVDYSFKSGLRRLGTLKELQHLSLHGVSHNITLAEIRWMAETWPHLCKIEYLSWAMDGQDAQTILEYAAQNYPWIQFIEDD
ncbi:hypothetical protein BGZ92_008546 [Podila epicladia]|nr:hypothetical protein BGZ92_008546 [Podila epicladia]